MIFGIISFDFAHLADTNTASIANRPRIGNPIAVQTVTKRTRSNLEDRFELDETFLSSPNTAALKSAVLRAVDRRTRRSRHHQVLAEDRVGRSTRTCGNSGGTECVQANACRHIPVRTKSLWR